jgi:hypothetical protein
VGSPRTKNPPYGNKSRIPYSEGSLPRKKNSWSVKYATLLKEKSLKRSVNGLKVKYPYTDQGLWSQSF